jgi:Oxidoreductase family, C-terminal alpha/beta domain
MWALRTNGQDGGLISIDGKATHPVPFRDGYPLQNDRYNTATNFRLKAAFPGGTELVIRDDTQNGVLIEGDKGRIFVNRGKLTGKPVDDLADDPLPEGAIQKAYKGFPVPVHLNGKEAHWENFVRCLRERKQPISDVESHMDALNVCHLAGISARLGRSIKWDSQAEQILGDEQANEFLAREYRKGFEIEV